jgi:hypothetical protein
VCFGKSFFMPPNYAMLLLFSPNGEMRMWVRPFMKSDHCRIELSIAFGSRFSLAHDFVQLFNHVLR